MVKTIVPIIFLLISLLYFGSTTIPKLSQPMISSEDGYSRLSTGIAESNPITRQTYDYIWPPITKIVYSLPYRLFADSQYLSVRIFSWLLVFFTLFIVGFITFQLSHNFNSAIIATCFAAINPLLINLSTQTLSENIWIFLVSLSFYFLLSHHQKYWTYGFIFWVLSQTCRYESWYLSPIVILFFWYYHRHNKPAIKFIIFSSIFPLYWIANTYLNTGTFTYYIDEKLRQALNGSPEIYYHFRQSLLLWLNKLNQIFSQLTITIFIVSTYHYIKKKNLLFCLPIFIFTSLVLQVYFATMEYYPHRYLILLPITIIPLTIDYIFSLNIRKSYLIIVLIIIFVTDATNITPRLSQLQEKVLPEIVQVGKYVSQKNPNCISFIKDVSSKNFNNSAFWYFSQKPLTDIIYMDTSNLKLMSSRPDTGCQIIVLEKSANFINFNHQTFENRYYRIFEPYGDQN